MHIVVNFSRGNSAIGVGEQQEEALKAVLSSVSRIAPQFVSDLEERIRDAMKTATSATLKTDFEDADWAVQIYW